jgi:hypothetical protein
MTPILDRFPPYASSAFRPGTRTELFALRLAVKLNDAVAASHYAGLLADHSEGQMISAWLRALKSGPRSDLGKSFHVELGKTQAKGSNGKWAKVIAIRVERRSVAVAVFYGDHLEYADVRHLASAKDKALASALLFVEWIADQFPADSAALESIPNGNEIQRQTISAAIIQALRARLLSIWEVAKPDLFRAYGHPPLKSRKELREVVSRILPSLGNTQSRILIKDAVALGLHVQIERLFLH